MYYNLKLIFIIIPIKLAPCSLAAPVRDCTRWSKLSLVLAGLDGAEVVLGPPPGREKDSELGGGGGCAATVPLESGIPVFPGGGCWELGGRSPSAGPSSSSEERSPELNLCEVKLIKVVLTNY